LRYLLEFMQELTGKPGRRLVKQLVQLQDLLGTYHDAIVTVGFVRHYAEGPGAQSGAASLLTLGALVNDALRLAEQNRQRFQRTWRRFTRKRTQRQFRTMLRELRGQDTTPDQQDDTAGPHASSDAATPAPADSPKTASSDGQPPVAENDSRPSEPEKP
jgi:CHAD domain-containing protein